MQKPYYRPSIPPPLPPGEKVPLLIHHIPVCLKCYIAPSYRPTDHSWWLCDGSLWTCAAVDSKANGTGKILPYAEPTSRVWNVRSHIGMST